MKIILIDASWLLPCSREWIFNMQKFVYETYETDEVYDCMGEQVHSPVFGGEVAILFVKKL